jgi:hypothetical protein
MSTPKIVIVRDSVPTPTGQIIVDVEFPLQQGIDEKSPNIMHSIIVDVAAAKAWLYDNPEKKIHDYVGMLLKTKFDSVTEAKTFSDQLLTDQNVPLPEE